MTQIIYGLTESSVSLGASTYWNWTSTDTGSTDETAVQSVAPCDFTITGFYVKLDAAPGAGASFTTAIRVNNGTSVASNAFGAADTALTWTGSVAVTAGQELSILQTYTGAPATASVYWAIKITLGTQQSIIVAGFDDPPSVLSQEYNQINGGDTWATASVGRYGVMPVAGTIKNLYVVTADDVGDPGDSYAFVVYKGGSAQTLTCTIADGSTACNDTAHPFTVAAGDYLYMSVQEAGTAAAANFGWGVEFDPDADGQSLVLGATEGNYSISADRYHATTASDGVAWLSTVSSRVNYAGFDTTFTNFNIILQNAPGAAKTFDMDIGQDSAGASYALTISFPNTTTGNAAGTVNISAGDNFWIRSNITASISLAGDSAWGLVQYIAPPITTQRRVFIL